MSEVYFSVHPNNITVQFNYNPLYVDAIRDVTGRRYDPSSRTWSVPLHCVVELVDIFCNIGVEIPEFLIAEYEAALACKVYQFFECSRNHLTAIFGSVIFYKREPEACSPARPIITVEPVESPNSKKRSREDSKEGI